MTNADKLRSMTDEELMGVIKKIGEVGSSYACELDALTDEVNHCNWRFNCRDCVLNWLKKENNGD